MASDTMPRISALVLVLALVGCGGPSASVTTINSKSACEAAFRRAAAVDPMRDPVRYLDDAVRACASEDEWRAASDAFPGALDGASPGAFLRNRCDFEPTLVNTALCISVAVPSS